MAKGALAAGRYAASDGEDPGFATAKRRTARFYAEHVLPLAPSLLPAVMGGAAVMAFDLEQL
jgi:hypothetical protein